MGDSDAVAIGQAGFLVLVGTAFGMFSRFLLRLALARTLLDDVFGATILFISFISIAAVICLIGLDQGIVKYISRTTHNGLQNQLITGAAILVMLCGILVAAIIILFNNFYPNILRGFSDLSEVMVIVAISIPIYSLYKLELAVFRGLMESQIHVFVSNIIQPFSIIILTTTAAITFGSIFSTAIAITASYAISALIGVVYLWKIGWRPEIAANNEIYNLVSFSLPLLVSATTYILISNFDKVALGYYMSSREIASYEVAVTVALLLSMFPTAFSFLLYPKVSEAVNENEKDISGMYTHSTKWILLFTTPAYVVLLLLPDGIVYLFGEKYITSKVMYTLSVFATGTYLNAITGPAGETLLGLGKSRRVMVYNVIAILLNIVLNIILIPLAGITGAAVASLFSYTIMNFLKAADIYLNHDINVINKNSILMGILGLSLPGFIWIFVPDLTSIFAILFAEFGLGLVSLGACVSYLYIRDDITDTDRELLSTITDSIRLRLGLASKTNK